MNSYDEDDELYEISEEDLEYDVTEGGKYSLDDY